MSSFNYSKWDNIECSSSEDEDDGRGDDRGMPQVTKFDNKSTITFGGNGPVTVADSTNSVDTPSAPTPTPAVRAPISPSKLPTPPPPSSPPTFKGGSFLYPSSPSNPIITSPQSIHWSQTSTSLTLSLLLPPSLKSPSITCTLKNASPFTSRNSTVGSPKTTLKITFSSHSVLSEILQHDVYINDEDETEDKHTPEWEVITYSKQSNDTVDTVERYLTITLEKATPSSNVVIWWTKVFRDVGEEVAVEREGGKGMKETWEEAHRMFREKVKGRGKEEVFY
ncbi:hypothetical protein TrVE_jg12506 [Triparma verrucosa]|uniref:CS domain-containing protein n=1 Tax=Triparma verrucosa TaxID=1606542 RepID=A0A9W7CE19_9STRA|nr:hypothetical protein TrVE_jg12506 [Triparma verrucosa]